MRSDGNEARQQVIDGTLSASAKQAHRCVELKDELAIAKARYERSLEALEKRMLDDDISEVYARGCRFSRVINEKIKCEGYTKPEITEDIEG